MLGRLPTKPSSSAMPTDHDRHIARLEALAGKLETSASTRRNADNTANGEKLAGEWEADARAIRWAIGQVLLYKAHLITP